MVHRHLLVLRGHLPLQRRPLPHLPHNPTQSGARLHSKLGNPDLPRTPQPRDLHAHLRPGCAARHPLPAEIDADLRHVFVMAIVVALGWLFTGCVYVLQAFMLRKYDLSASDNIQARRIHTQFQVYRLPAAIIEGVVRE